jgi:hypothetical protein
MKFHRILLCSLVALGACEGDRSRAEVGASVNAMSPAEYRRRQETFADSVLRAAKSVSALVEQLGEGYAVGSPALRDTIAALARQSDCFQAGRRNDPYLAGAVSVFVKMTTAGADRVQVQEASWTSKAGDMVNVCLNQAMKNWKLGRVARFAGAVGYLVQVRFRSDSATAGAEDQAEKPKRL